MKKPEWAWMCWVVWGWEQDAGGRSKQDAGGWGRPPQTPWSGRYVPRPIQGQGLASSKPARNMTVVGEVAGRRWNLVDTLADARTVQARTV
jgi:hypothetical protein